MNRQPAGPTRRAERSLYAVLGIACVIRLAFVLLYPQLPVVNDAAAYDQQGFSIAFSHGVLQGNDGPIPISKGPVYPIFLAVIYRIAGYHHTAARVVQALLSAWSVLLIYKLAQTVFPPGIALIASALAAIYPPFISYSGLLLTEIASVVLLLAFIHSVIKGVSGSAGRWWVAAGVWGGLLVLHREETLLLLVCIVAAVWWWRIGWSRLGLMLGTVALIVLPWVVRNHRVYQAWVLNPAQQGAQVWLSTYAARWQEWHNEDPYYRSVVDVDGLNLVQQDRRLLREGLKQILEHPWVYLTMCLQRIPRFWVGGHSDTFVHLEQSLGSYVRQGKHLTASRKVAMLLYNLSLIAGGFAGMYLAWKLSIVDGRHLILLALPVITTAVVHFFLFAVLRYQVPIMPFVIIFAAYSIGHLRHQIRDLLPVHE